VKFLKRLPLGLVFIFVSDIPKHINSDKGLKFNAFSRWKGSE